MRTSDERRMAGLQRPTITTITKEQVAKVRYHVASSEIAKWTYDEEQAHEWVRTELEYRGWTGIICYRQYIDHEGIEVFSEVIFEEILHPEYIRRWRWAGTTIV